MIIQLPSDEHALQLAERSVSIRCVVEHWASAKTYNLFHSRLKEYIATNGGHAEFDQRIKSTFRITVETYNKHIQQKQKVDKIETLAYLPFEGEVALKQPDSEYFYIEFYGLDPNNVPEQPDQILFGRWVCDVTFNFYCEFICLRPKLFSWQMEIEHKSMKSH